MKTRADLYSHEAVGLLRDITMYRVLEKEQLFRLHPGKRDKIENLLTHLTKQGRIWLVDGRYCASPDCAEQVDRGLLAAVWVLADFIDQVEYHSVSDFPAKIIFFAEGEVYEIIHVEQGKEMMISHLLSVPKEEPSKYIVLVDDLSQLQHLDLPPVNGYCTVSPNGEVQYYKKNRRTHLDRAILSKRITSILSDISRLNSALYALNTTDIQRYPENYEVLSTDAALRAERIACRLRHIIYAATPIKKEEYLTSAAVMQGVEIQEEDGIIEIKLPCLLPKRKQRQSTEFLLDPFTAALAQFAKSHAMPRLRHCVVCFSHVYCKDLPLQRVRDYDNLELKQFLDVAASFILTDDSGLLCDAYNTTELGPEDCTRISIMDSARFPDWLDARQTALRSIKDL